MKIDIFYVEASLSGHIGKSSLPEPNEVASIVPRQTENCKHDHSIYVIILMESTGKNYLVLKLNKK